MSMFCQVTCRTANLDFLAFNKPSDLLHEYSKFDYLVKEAILERQLKYSGDSFCLNNWHFDDMYTDFPLIRSGLFFPGPVCWPSHECSWLLFVLMSIASEYYPNLVIIRRTPEPIIRNVAFEVVVVLLFRLFFQHLLVSLFVLVVNLQVLKIWLPGEYFSLYLTLFTTLCGLLDFPGSCPIALSIL